MRPTCRSCCEGQLSSHFLNRQQLNNQEWNFHGGREGIQRFLTLPTTWPLARLMFPIRDLRRQMETLLQTYCFEIEVTCAQAREQDAFVRRMALHLVQYLAVFLAETITGLLQRVLTHPARGLVDETNAALLTQKFWVQAIYTELLCASSRHRAVREQEKQRPPTGLVKVVCLPFWWCRCTETWPKKTHGCKFWNHAWPQQLGRFFVCMVSSILDAPGSGCHKGKKLCIQPGC